MTATAELQRIARDVIPPVGATTLIAVVEHTPGGRLAHPLEAYPNGVGGTTRFGVAWLVDGRIRTKPFVTFDRPRDASNLIRILRGESPASRSVAESTGGSQRPSGTPVRDGVPPSSSPVLEVGTPRAEGGIAVRSPRAHAAGAMPESLVAGLTTAGHSVPVPQARKLGEAGGRQLRTEESPAPA